MWPVSHQKRLRPPWDVPLKWTWAAHCPAPNWWNLPCCPPCDSWYPKRPVLAYSKGEARWLPRLKSWLQTTSDWSSTNPQVPSSTGKDEGHRTWRLRPGRWQSTECRAPSGRRCSPWSNGSRPKCDCRRSQRSRPRSPPPCRRQHV